MSLCYSILLVVHVKNFRLKSLGKLGNMESCNLISSIRLQSQNTWNFWSSVNKYNFISNSEYFMPGVSGDLRSYSSSFGENSLLQFSWIFVLRGVKGWFQKTPEKKIQRIQIWRSNWLLQLSNQSIVRENAHSQTLEPEQYNEAVHRLAETLYDPLRNYRRF